MKTLRYPPLTQSNIITLKGEPVTKMINSSKRKNTLDMEKWTYYNIPIKTKEHYLFKNGKLIGYLRYNYL